MTIAILSFTLISFSVAWLGTLAMKRLAPRIGLVGKPGHRTVHPTPIPLGGGVAIFLASALPLLAAVAAAWVVNPSTPPPGGLHAFRHNWPAYVGGARQQTAMALSLVAAMAVMHVMGLRDDRKALGPY